MGKTNLLRINKIFQYRIIHVLFKVFVPRVTETSKDGYDFQHTDSCDFFDCVFNVKITDFSHLTKVNQEIFKE